MKFSVLKNLLSDTWQIDAMTFSQNYPLFKRMIDGGSFEVEPEAENSLPYVVTENAERTEKTNPNNGEYVQVIPVRGVMLKHDAECGPVGMRTIGNRLRQAYKDDNAVSVMLVFESGGGQSTAVPEIAEAIQERNKPVLVFVDGIMASAAMYAGSYADYIIASRNDDYIGSIGTMIEYYAPKKQSEDSDGNVYLRVYADASTEKNYEFEQAINDMNVRPVIENILNPVNKKFHSDIKKNRPNVTEEQLKGGIFKAKDVVGSLIDEVNTFDKAISKAFKMGKEKKKSNKKDTNMKIKMSSFPLIGKFFAKQETQETQENEEVEINEESLSNLEKRQSELEAKIAENESKLQETLTKLSEKETENSELSAKSTEQLSLIESLKNENESLKNQLKGGKTQVVEKEDPNLEDAHNIKTKNLKSAEENLKNIKGDD